MRIAFVTYEYAPFIIGGAGVYATRITCQLASMGHQVYVITAAADAHHHPERNIFVRARRKSPAALGTAAWFWIGLPREVRRLHREFGFDVVHVNGVSCAWMGSRPLSNLPHVLTVHHVVKDIARGVHVSLPQRLSSIRGEAGLPVRVFESQAINHADSIIADSEFTRQRIIYHYNLSRERVDVIHPGIDPVPPFRTEDLKAARNQMELGNGPLIFSVSRLDDPRKGIAFLLKAFKKVADKHDVTLVLAGGGNQNEPREMVRKLGIKERVKMLGFVNDSTMNTLLSLCSVYASSSSLEGFGLSIGAALSAGKPVVALRAGIVPEFESLTAHLRIVAPGDINGFSAALSSCLDNPWLVPASAMVEGAAILAAFNWQRTGELTEKVYRRVTGDS